MVLSQLGHSLSQAYKERNNYTCELLLNKMLYKNQPFIFGLMES